MSKIETQKHIDTVRTLIEIMREELWKRKESHDKSKLQSPEVEIFEIYTPKLKGSRYGSDEYKTFLKEMKVALDHHYANNSHHPEFFVAGIRGMTLIDIIEMLCDWKAATIRHADGDIFKSLEINQKRFGYSAELNQIFINTVKKFF